MPSHWWRGASGLREGGSAAVRYTGLVLRPIFILPVFAVVLASGGCESTSRGRISLEEACNPGSARICKCDAFSDGAQLCGSDLIWESCNCSIALSAAYCSEDYVLGEEAKCIAEAPTCEILAPLSGTLLGNKLRTSTLGAPYATRFEVGTALDAESVLLVSGSNRYSAAAVQGIAVFDNVTLANDGMSEVSVTCFGRAGVPKKIPPVSYLVDSTAPGLTVSQPQADTHFGPASTFQACATTTGGDTESLCASAAGQPEVCIATDGCIPLWCPGGAPFSVTVRSTDRAANETVTTIPGVSCASNATMVLVQNPAQGERVLAADQTAPRKDRDAQRLGAQYDVTVCTSANAGVARLYAGRVGNAATMLAESSTFIAAATQCPEGYSHVVMFDVTLPESSTLPGGDLDQATRLFAEVDEVSRERGTSPSVDVWVDSTAPLLSLYPRPFCGGVYAGTGPFTTDVWLYANVSSFSFITTHPDQNGAAPLARMPTEVDAIYGYAKYANVQFLPGTTLASVTITESSGNITRLPDPCAYTVGDNIAAYWMLPNANFGVGNEGPTGSTGASGWQGTLRISADIPTGSVDFVSDVHGTLATGVPCVNQVVPYNLRCEAEVQVSLADAASATITATISAPGRSPGQTSTTVRIDTTPPLAPTNVSATIVDRRAGTFDIRWTAPAGERVSDYDVYAVKNAQIGEPLPPGAESFNYLGATSLPGQPDGIRVYNRVIEQSYGFAVCARDASGNRGPCAFVQDLAAHFNIASFANVLPNDNPWPTDGSCDHNGDGINDVLLGTYTGRSYLYFGQRQASSLAAIAVTFSGESGAYFGWQAKCAGDLDGDGLADIVIPASGADVVYIFKGRTQWPATLTHLDADATVELDTTSAPDLAGAGLGGSVARLGDFDGDGADDLAIGASNYGYNEISARYEGGYLGGYGQGLVFVLRGVRQGEAMPGRMFAPADEGSRLIRITGEAPPFSHNFGYDLQGIGRFDPNAGGTTLLSCGWGGRNGYKRGWAITGTQGMSFQQSVLDHERTMDFYQRSDCTSSAVVGSALNTTIFANIGTLVEQRDLPGPSGVTGPAQPGHWIWQISFHRTNPSLGVFGGDVVTAVNDRFLSDGFVTGVGAHPSEKSGLNLFGGPGPDYIFAPTNSAGLKTLYGFSSEQITNMAAGSSHWWGEADFVWQLPLPWEEIALSGTAGDINGDGYSEIMLAETVGYAGYSPLETAQWIILW